MTTPRTIKPEEIQPGDVIDVRPTGAQTSRRIRVESVQLGDTGFWPTGTRIHKQTGRRIAGASPWVSRINPPTLIYRASECPAGRNCTGAAFPGHAAHPTWWVPKEEKLPPPREPTYTVTVGNGTGGNSPVVFAGMTKEQTDRLYVMATGQQVFGIDGKEETS